MPDAQVLHDVAVATEIFPATQFVQAAAPAAEKVPAPHLEHPVASLVPDVLVADWE